MTEMIKIESWIIQISDFNSDNPKYFYNPVTDSFDNKFSNQCAFFSEEEAVIKNNELNIGWTNVSKGTFDFPKEEFIDHLTNVLYPYIKNKSTN